MTVVLLLDIVFWLLLTAGIVFFAAGTAGVLRFDDTLGRIHAVTKADNLGLGLVILALILRADDAEEVIRLGVVWVVALTASAAACQLIAREAASGSSEDPDASQSEKSDLSRSGETRG